MMGNFCPLIGTQCKGAECSWWVRLMVKEADSMKEISSCAVPLSINIGIDTSKAVTRVQQSVESSRNVNHKIGSLFKNIFDQAVKQKNKLING